MADQVGRYKRARDLEGAQVEAALVEENAVVAAGAGSGKTTVLAARYVRLLEEGRLRGGSRVHARNVLVLTFTRKAAAEMHGRIYGALAEAAALAERTAAALAERGAAALAEDAAGGGSAEAAELAAHLGTCLAEFSQAQISTFDSFAGRIARSGSARYGLAPDFQVDDEAARESALRLALDFILERRDEAAMRELVAANGFVETQEALADLAVARMPLSSPPDFAAMHARQEGLLRAELGRLRAALLDERAAALEHAGGKVPAGVQAWLDAFAADPVGIADPEEIAESEGIADSSAAGEGRGEAGEARDPFLSWLAGFEGKRKPGSNSASEAGLYLNAAVDGFKELASAYRDHAAALAAHPARSGLYRLLDEFRPRWDDARRAAKTLSFRDAATMALDLLSGDPELRALYKGLYRYVMIDEFQDDDELQKRVLYLVAEREGRREKGEPAPGELEPDKLFFVGDEKQSIYLFRGADVSVFRALAKELAASAPDGKPRRLVLSRNYRSEPGLIELLNGLFPVVMRPEDGREGDPHEAAFEPLLGREPIAGVEPAIRYLELPYRPDSAEGLRSRAECEAWAIAEFIRDSVESGSLAVADRKAGRARPARYEDFAVLFRATGKQIHLEKYLRLLGVPYASESACGLFSEAVAGDLYYALRLAAHPEDGQALAAYLRSPFAALDDERIAGLLLSGDGGLEGPFAAADPAFARARATMSALRGMVDRETIASCVSYLWYEAGYRAALLSSPGGPAFEEHFELVHSLAVRADAEGKPLAAFVAGLEPLVGSPEKLDEAEIPRESARGVRLMTIHKSKGLEFPVVVLPQANNAGRNGGAPPWAWDDEAGATFRLPAPGGDPKKRNNVFYERAAEERGARQRAEAKRLLYVALTRAESQILVTATAPRREEREKPKSFRSFLFPAIGLASGESASGESASGESASGESASGENASGEGASGDADAAAEGARAAAGVATGAGAPLPVSELETGRLRRLPSGILAGLIRERSDEDYEALLGSARARAGRPELPDLPLVERRVEPRRRAVSAIAAEYAASRAGPAEAAGAAGETGPETLAVPPGLEPPPGLPHELWGSLVHALIEAALVGGALPEGPPGEEGLEPSLRSALESALPSAAARLGAMERAALLAEVFLGSELGRRAFAARERLVEWPLAIRYGATRVARGQADLVVVEGDRAIVVDYKTDRELEPGRYDLQVAAYRRAAEAILGLPTEAYIFYLYGGGRSVRVGEEAPGLDEAPLPERRPFEFSFAPAPARAPSRALEPDSDGPTISAPGA